MTYDNDIDYSAPTYNIDTKEWTYTDFKSRKEKRDFVDSHFKYPSEYDLKYSHGYWNEQGVYWQTHNTYPIYVKNSVDFIKHWDFEKEKCRFDGFIIYKSDKENLSFVVSGLYYWYLNYCPIYDKVKGRPDLPGIWDTDYHYYLYILRCLFYGKYGVVLKKRQCGFSLKNMSIILNSFWFGDGWINKVFAYDEGKVDDSWAIMDKYKEHINKYCGWKRYISGSDLDWEQSRKTRDGQSKKGNMCQAKGFSTRAGATKGVGGSIKVLFGEEAGINPTLDKTHEYVISNVSLGGVTTGLIIYSGAVGELDKCEPLKKYMLKPEKYGFLSCENVIEEDIKEFGHVPTGFFAPEWWNYMYEDAVSGEIIKCYDEWGNTNKEMAMKRILEIERPLAEERDPEDFRHWCSQRPFSITEAFAYRKDAVFPQELLTKQLHRIERGDYPYKTYDLYRDEDGIKTKDNLYPPNIEYPFKPKKGIIPYGCVQIWEDVIIDPSTGRPPRGLYYAAVDPIQVDVTTTSDSLFCVYIFKNATEVTYIDKDGKEKTRMDGDRIVAKYLGRKQDRNTTNETGMMLIEYYNALAVVENNFDNFIQYAIKNQKQRYLAMKDDLPFTKDLSLQGFNSSKEYGVRTNKTMWEQQYIPKPIEYMKEEIGVEHKNDGSIFKIVYGIEKIPDGQLIKEYLAFTDEKGNYDSIVTFGLVLALAKSRQANQLISKIREGDSVKKPDPNLYKNHKSFFSPKKGMKKYNKSAFKNIR